VGLIDEIRKLAKTYDDDDEFEDYTPKASERVPVPQRTSAVPKAAYEPYEDSRRSGNKVVNIHATTQLQVVLVKPEKFDTAAEIADHLKEKRTVVLNLESTSKEIARRLIDFLSGVAYANEGKIKKVAVSTYIITPYSVEIIGDLIDELEHNGLYF